MSLVMVFSLGRHSVVSLLTDASVGVRGGCLEDEENRAEGAPGGGETDVEGKTCTEMGSSKKIPSAFGDTDSLAEPVFPLFTENRVLTESNLRIGWEEESTDETGDGLSDSILGEAACFRSFAKGEICTCRGSHEPSLSPSVLHPCKGEGERNGEGSGGTTIRGMGCCTAVTNSRSIGRSTGLFLLLAVLVVVVVVLMEVVVFLNCA